MNKSTKLVWKIVNNKFKLKDQKNQTNQLRNFNRKNNNNKNK